MLIGDSELDEIVDGPPLSTEHPLRSMLAGPPSMVGLPSSSAQQRIFRIRAAETPRERRSASALLSRMYATRGYESPSFADEESAFAKTFLASDHNTALGTLTIGLDSSAGLKVDALFPEITRGLRDAGHRICEFTQLAMDRSARSPRLLASLFHVAYIYAHRINGLTHLLIEVNPRHVRYYEIMLGFDVISSARHNHRVNAPAVLLSLDLCHAARQIGVFGGRPEMAITERSAYPHFFSLKDELGIVGRLHRSDVDIAHVLEAGPRRAIPSTTGPLH